MADPIVISQLKQKRHEDSFDFAAIPSLNKPLVMDLARSEYIDRRENINALGPSGTGKTHIALGLGLTACQKGMKVRFTTAASLAMNSWKLPMKNGCCGCRSNLPPIIS